jgi:hypothetical protein
MSSRESQQELRSANAGSQHPSNRRRSAAAARAQTASAHLPGESRLRGGASLCRPATSSPRSSSEGDLLLRGRGEVIATALRGPTEDKAARSSVGDGDGAGAGHATKPAGVNGVRGGGERAPTRSPQTHIPPGPPDPPVTEPAFRSRGFAVDASSQGARRRTALEPFTTTSTYHAITSKEQL